MSDTVLQEALQKSVECLKQIFGSKLQDVILYGSYARGDYDDESDVDIAAIVDIERININAHMKPVAELMSDLSLEYEVLISIATLPAVEFDYWKDNLPYYRNIVNEGVRLSA